MQHKNAHMMAKLYVSIREKSTKYFSAIVYSIFISKCRTDN